MTSSFLLNSLNLAKASQFKRGFTLIELLIVVSVIGILVVLGIASFSSYSDKQTLSQAANNLSSVLEKAKSNAISRIVPDSSKACSSPLSYSVNFSCSGSYSLLISCPQNPVTSNFNLPKGISVKGANCSSLTFYPSTNVLGCSPSGNSPLRVALADKNNNIRLITVDNGGNTSISSPTLSSLQNQNYPGWWSCP